MNGNEGFVFAIKGGPSSAPRSRAIQPLLKGATALLNGWMRTPIPGCVYDLRSGLPVDPDDRFQED